MNILNPYRHASANVITDNLAFCYSFTKIVSSATYTCRIRRDNDDAETDILLESSGACDINSTVSAGGTLATWIGSNNGFMVTDYDQTGNFDFTQSDKTKQAKIVDAGSWLGYKEYDGSNDIYLTSTAWTATEGSVYVKQHPTSTSTRYFLSQAKTGQIDAFSLCTSFGTGNQVRGLSIQGGAIYTWNSTNTISSLDILTYRYGSVNGHTIRINSTNETVSETGTDTGQWFGTANFTASGWTMQKGRLDRTANVGAAYREYELLGYDIEHTDSEAAIIEAIL